MKYTLDNIREFWYKTTEPSLKIHIVNHLRTSRTWRFMVAHQSKGVNTMN